MITPLRVLAVGVALGMLLSGCSGDDGEQVAAPTSSPTPTPPPTAPPAERPPSRACYRATYEEVLSATWDGTPVSCRKRHQTQTFKVARVNNLADGHLLAIDSDQVQDDVATRCPKILARFIGGTEEQQRLSMLRAVWFTPSLEESDAGADWFRCDVVALAGGEELSNVKGSLRGVLDTEAGREKYGMCATAAPGRDDFTRVPCSAQHRWRAFSTLDLAGKKYPGKKKIRAAGEEPCQDAAAAEAEDPLDYDFGYEGPTKEQWEQGVRYIRCWAPD